MLWQEIEHRWGLVRNRSPEPATYSDWIAMVMEYLRQENFKVVLDPELEPVGRISYSERLIRINEPSAHGALMVLAHEYGHWISYARYYNRIEQPSKVQCEIWAFKFGWCFLKLIKAPITRSEWIEYHSDDFEYWSQNGEL